MNHTTGGLTYAGQKTFNEVIKLNIVEIIAIILVAVFELGAIAFIFISKSLLHSVISLTLAFIGNSALFLILNQPFLAIIQLFIFVGGISTYALVGVASSSFSKFRHTNKASFIIVFIIMLVAISYPVLGMALPHSSYNLFSTTQIKSGLDNYMGLFYLISAMLFTVGISSIILFKSIGSIK